MATPILHPYASAGVIDYTMKNNLKCGGYLPAQARWNHFNTIWVLVDV